jgi:NIMA (never in mitosis gene a)-related kinase
MNARMKAEAINEVTILSKLDHAHIVKYYDSFLEKNFLNIIMEYCSGGDLCVLLKQQFGRPLPENKIWKYFIEICLALEYIHRKKILHRDIKTMNVFLDKNEQVRIGDLGVAKVLQDNSNFAHTMVGTPFYLSPEMCEEKPYNEKSDVWALGCVLYEMCTFRHPFEAKTQAALILRIIRGKYDSIPSIYSKDLVEMIDSCLRRDHNMRPTVSAILQKQALIKRAEQLSIDL